MVAEAIPEVEVEQAQGQVPETPESIPEQEVQQEAEAEDDFEAVLAELLPEEPVTGEAKDAQAPAGGPEDSLKDLTPAQIKALGRQERDAELNEQIETTNKRNREQGLRNTLAASRTDLTTLLKDHVADPQVILDAVAKLDQVHGAHLALKDPDLTAKEQETLKRMQGALAEAGQKFLGDKDFDPVGLGMDGYIERIAEHARKGYKSPSEVKDERKAAQIDILKRLKAAGVEIPTGAVSAPSDARAAGGSGSKQYSQMTPEERNALSPEARDAAVAREAARRT